MEKNSPGFIEPLHMDVSFDKSGSDPHIPDKILTGLHPGRARASFIDYPMEPLYIDNILTKP
jgi:hypothetical protein